MLATVAARVSSNLRVVGAAPWRGAASVSGAAHFPDGTWKQPDAVSHRVQPGDSQHCWDAVVVGAGHNGLTAAAYLAKAGHRVLVLESRSVIGGAAVTEELVPGFQFSRCSYVNSLFRDEITRDLNLRDYGLTMLPRNPSSFTVLPNGKYLIMGHDAEATAAEVAKFSDKDAENLPRFYALLERFARFFDPLLLSPPPDLAVMLDRRTGFRERAEILGDFAKVGLRAMRLGRDVPALWELLTAPAGKILSRWFESEPLRATLAMDAVIGGVTAPSVPGSGYMLFHHVMGESEGVRGVWHYVKGGMGSISNTIAAAAVDAGAVIRTNSAVKQLLLAQDDKTCYGVELGDGTRIEAKHVLSNIGPVTTFGSLLSDAGQAALPTEFKDYLRGWDMNSAVFKINLALDRLPNFKCLPNSPSGEPQPHHRGTIHFSSSMEDIEAAYRDALAGKASKAPLVEMTIPSAVDASVAPPGKHVAQLFVQYAPYKLARGTWDEKTKKAFAARCYKVIERVAPGFTKSIVGADLLSPLDLETIFGLRGGNISHGSMSVDQMLWMRPAPGWSRYQSPVDSLWMCGAGTHPGGGVMGLAGRNAAQRVGVRLAAAKAEAEAKAERVAKAK